jgi:DNA helicase HerA-like ATPase
MYDEEGRAEDTLLATVRDLARYRLFADVSERPIDRAFGVRWVIDLAGLQALRTFVGFVLVEFLHQAARALPDAAYDPAAEVRGVRGVVAVDEAHYYFRHRCQPVLDLLRVGRSKGVPVFLSSQSLEDFKRYTELSEFLPNTFVFRHGMPPDARTMAGALHTDLGEGASAAARTTSLDKFHALAALSGGEAVGTGPYRRLVLKGFWERGKR